METPQALLTWTLQEAEIIDNRIIGAIIVVIAVCAVAIYFSTQYVPPAETYKISGYVKTNGIGLPGVAVMLDGKSATTDANGYYEFTGLEGNKSYTLAVSKSGYESYSETVQLGTDDKQVSDIILKTIEMPLTEITNALASMEGVSAENVSLYFCVQAAENNTFAAGAVVSRQKSIVFFYNESTSTITAENEYSATTSDELQGMSTLAAKETISRFTSYRIVPFGLVKTGGAFNFTYYDGYDMYLLCWGHGEATLDENGAVTLNTHIWS